MTSETEGCPKDILLPPGVKWESRKAFEKRILEEPNANAAVIQVYKELPRLEKPFTRIADHVHKRPQALNSYMHPHDFIGAPQKDLCGWLFQLALDAGTPLNWLTKSTDWWTMSDALLAASDIPVRPDYLALTYQLRAQLYAFERMEKDGRW